MEEFYNYTRFTILSADTKLAKSFIRRWILSIHSSVWGLYKNPSSEKLDVWSRITANTPFNERKTMRVWGNRYSYTVAYKSEEHRGLCVHTRTKSYLIKGCFNVGAIPKYGEEFYAYKYAKGRYGNNIIDCIVKLRIPKSARRVGNYWQKCRASSAYIEEVRGMFSGKLYDRKTFDSLSGPYYHGDYRGAKVVAHYFDKDPSDECLPGIHFFMSYDEAVGFARRDLGIS